MAETRSTVYISTNLTNRANTIKGCIICNPYKWTIPQKVDFLEIKRYTKKGGIVNGKNSRIPSRI